jgi:hypothetical protein
MNVRNISKLFSFYKLLDKYVLDLGYTKLERQDLNCSTFKNNFFRSFIPSLLEETFTNKSIESNSYLNRTLIDILNSKYCVNMKFKNISKYKF